MNDTDLAVRASYALHLIPSTIAHDDRARVGMGARDAGVTFDDYNDWQMSNPRYDPVEVRSMWNSYKDGPVKVATLFHIAKEYGYQAKGDRTAPMRQQATRKTPEPPRKPAKGMSPAEVWERLKPASNQHGYVNLRNIANDCLPQLREVPASDPICKHQPVAGFLAVPAYGHDGVLQSIQFVPPNGGKKLNLAGAAMSGASLQIGPTDGPVVFGESLGNASAVYMATGGRAVSCFGSGNIKRVVESFRQREPNTPATIAPDRGKEGEAFEIAAQFNCRVACLPETEASNFDLNDLLARDGFDVLAQLLDAAAEPAPPPLALSVAFADQLPDKFEPHDELVQGLLTAGDGSVLYGDSNSGKTFFVIDMACAVARGVEWMGRKTEPGMVVYLAAESPASVRSRLQAYQRHHGVKVPNFAIVQSPIDLFDGEADTNKVIQVIRQLEKQTGQKARLIVGDTLARLSAGANENAGQDMGLVVRRFDRIRTECKAHFCLIHHSGKAAANGARGWSGIRAAVDTELEITDSPAGRCCEITKQRDLSTKGQRIGFKLEPVVLGFTKWGAEASSCVVVSADAPAKKTGKRMSECDGAVLEFLAAHKVGIRKMEVVKHFEGRYEKGPIYRAMKALVTAQAVHEAAGMVAIAGVAK